MQRNPRPSPITGLSTLGTLLLALAGAGMAVFFVVRMTSSRAAEARRSPPPLVQDVLEGTTAAEPRPAELVQAFSPETDPALESETPPTAAPAAAATIQTVQPVLALAETEKPKIEGPPLKHIRGGGKAPVVSRKDLRAPQRERRKEQREQVASGVRTEPPPRAFQKASKFENNPNRWKLKNRGGKGSSRSRN